MHETDININKCQSFYFFYTFFAFFVAICCWIFCCVFSQACQCWYFVAWFLFLSVAVLRCASSTGLCQFDPPGMAEVDIFRDNEAVITQVLLQKSERELGE